MIGDMIAKVRKEKGMTKTELAKRTGINIVHLTPVSYTHLYYLKIRT